MEKYLLFYEITDWPDMGGGSYLVRFSEATQMDEFVNSKINDENFRIVAAVEVAREFKYKPVEIITKLGREEA